MKRFAPVLLITALITAPALAQERVSAAPSDGQDRSPIHSGANPSAVIAAEVGFNQLAQKKGQWTAFLETAAPDAEMFTPFRVKAATWLKGRPNPPQSVKWQPHEVWSSCDGSYAVTRGGWERPDGTFGYFTTLWQRQPKNAGYKWLLDQGNDMPVQIAAPEMIGALVAECRPRTPEAAPPPEPPRGKKPVVLPLTPETTPALPGTEPIAISLEGDRKDGRSRDATLDWSSVVAQDGARIFVVRLWREGEMREVLRSVVNPAPGVEGAPASEG